MTDLTPIRRPVRAVARRIRLQRAMGAGAILAIAGLGGAGLVVALMKAAALPPGEAVAWLYACAALPLVGALVGALRPVRRLVPAQRLDRAHGLRSRIASAVEFAELPATERTPFMEAAIADALRHAASLEPKRAMPLRAPRDLAIVAGLAMGVAALAVLEVPERAVVPMGSQLDPLLLHQDDIDAFAGGLDALVNDPDTDDEVRDAARRFNQLMEDLADRRLDRTEALRRISQLEQRLMDGRGLDAEALRDSLRELGDSLRSSLTQAASDALRDGDAARAEQAMRELANQIRSDPPSRAELERLRQALERAAEEQRSAEDIQREIDQQRQQMDRLLQRQREKNDLGERERRLLERRRRDLERLERQQQQQQEQQRQLDRLRRELEQAAEDLRREMNEQAGESLDRGAEELNRMAQQQLSEEQMQQLTEQLRQLREMLRRQRQQQAQNGQGQGQQGQGQGQGRMDRFVLRARGQGDGQGVPLLMPGGQPGQAGQGGQGQQGGNQEGQGQQALMPGGSGNAQLELPGMGQRPQGQQGGEGGGGVGPGAGTGHDGQMLDQATQIDSTRRNIRVQGEESQGPTRSEVILSAADRGFAQRGYREVYTDYESHAEEVLETDEIPPGYRFYLRRYFQLIRPRESE
jgi:hypothetical protein